MLETFPGLRGIDGGVCFDRAQCDLERLPGSIMAVVRTTWERGHLTECGLEGCTTGRIGLPNPNQRSVVKTSGFLHPYIYFLALEGEGMTWMRQPLRQGIALFSVRMEFSRSTGIL